jgi:hypothetical protein
VFTLQTLNPAAGTAAPQAAPAGQEADSRPGGLDLVLLLDKSLSMAPFFEKAKSYAAGEVLGPILAPGDRLIVDLVYGKVDRLFTGTIAGEEDKAKAIRSLRAVVADGRFTDLGAALDAAKAALDELGMPERPKYVLLVSDEVQEAPAGSPYISLDHKLRHPALEYVRRTDLGRFRAIVVGFGVGAKVDATAPRIMKLLSEPPNRGAAAPGAAGSSLAAGAGGSSGARAAGEASGHRLPAVAVAALAAAAVLVLAGCIFALLHSKRKSSEKDGKPVP